MTIDPLLHRLVVLALASLLLVAAGHKLANPARFRVSLASYGLVPDALLGVGSILLPFVEFLIGGTLLSENAGLTGAALRACAILLFAYAGAIAVNLGRGNSQIDCGCLGSHAGKGELHWSMVARNVLLASAAMVLSGVEPGAGARPLTWFDWINLGFAIAVLWLLYLGHEAWASLPRRERR